MHHAYFTGADAPYDKLLNARQREEVIRRAHGCCEYCLSQELYSPDSFSVEHIVPLAKGGTMTLKIWHCLAKGVTDAST
jgi:5-methylcytosine-specific restriction endonuclease McrA